MSRHRSISPSASALSDAFPHFLLLPGESPHTLTFLPLSISDCLRLSTSFSFHTSSPFTRHLSPSAFNNSGSLFSCCTVCEVGLPSETQTASLKARTSLMERCVLRYVCMLQSVCTCGKCSACLRMKKWAVASDTSIYHIYCMWLECREWLAFCEL